MPPNNRKPDNNRRRPPRKKPLPGKKPVNKNNPNTDKDINENKIISNNPDPKAQAENKQPPKNKRFDNKKRKRYSKRFSKPGAPNNKKDSSNNNNRPGNKRPEKKPKIVYEICPFCNKEISVPSTAIKDKASLKNAHFDCVLDSIRATVKLEENEKLYYLGSGSFGIVREIKSRNKTRLFVRKRIQYEERAPKNMPNTDKDKKAETAEKN